MGEIGFALWMFLWMLFVGPVPHKQGGSLFPQLRVIDSKNGEEKADTCVIDSMTMSAPKSE
jgi:hypothetical protein